jgi:hypothetical protein
LGLKLYEWLTLGGVIIGPIVAVAITLIVEGRRQSNDRQANIARTLIGTRHVPADPLYNGAINLIPVEFNKNARVMQAWREYMRLVRQQPTEANAAVHDEDVKAKQSTLIYEILVTLGYTLSESDLRTTAYLSQASVNRELIFLRAWDSWPRIAAALEGQVIAATEGLNPQGPTNTPDPFLSGPASPST